MSTFRITSLGCKVNYTEGLSLAEALSRAGWVCAPDGETPDAIVVNTCCVTAVAMRKSRQILRREIRRAPTTFVCVVGCYATYHRDRIEQLLDEAGVPSERRVIAGHHEDVTATLNRLLTPHSACSLQRTCPEKRITPQTLKHRRTDAVHHSVPGTQHLPAYAHDPAHQRAFVKIQDGCDAFCTYCVVTYTRPRVTWRPADEILDQCRALLDAGHRELVLCGIFLGAYGRSTAIRRRWNSTPSPLADLVRRIADLPGLWRVRLSSLEPLDLTDELLDLTAGHPAVAPHFHLPLQSGSNAILRRMNRQYTADDYRRAVDRLRSVLDRPALTTDVIVGFPGESDDDFAETVAVARHAEFAKMHIFPFSPVEPTLAWKRRAEMPPHAVIRSRIDRLSDVEADLARAVREQFVGETVEALIETVAGDQATAMTDRYLTVAFPCEPTIRPSDLVRVKITAVTDDGLAGRHIL